VTSADDRPHHENELNARRASSFGAQAFAYAEHRPDYPVAAVRWALEPVSGAPLRVLDLAAGTGKLTGVLVAEGHQVTAVEPDEAMLSELVRRHGGVRALPGTAERIPLPDGTVDAVLIGQAFHWFDPDRALPEIARVLRPGGVVVGLWNYGDDSVEWLNDFDKVVQTSASFAVTGEEPMPTHPLFADSEKADFPHVYRRTAESLIAMINTHSHALVVSAAERAELNERALAFLRAHPVTATGEFDYPMITYTRRMTRL
jgi:SAM-dependent methyltransferase